MDIRDVKDFMIQLNEDASIKHQLDELSKATLGRYTQRAFIDAIQKETERGYNLGKRDMGRRFGLGDIYNADVNKHSKSVYNRRVGIDRAIKKLTKEDIEQLEEARNPPIVLGHFSKVKGLEIHLHDDGKDKVTKKPSKSVSLVHGAQKQTIYKGLNRTHLENRAELIKHLEDVHGDKFKKSGGITWNPGSDINRATDRLVKEDIEQLDEISKALLRDYIVYAGDDKGDHERHVKDLKKARDALDNVSIGAHRKSLQTSHIEIERAKKLGTDYETQAAADKAAKNTIMNNLWDREQAHKRQITKRNLGIKKALNKLVKEDINNLVFSAIKKLTKEDVGQLDDFELELLESLLDKYNLSVIDEEQIDEISKELVGRYLKKAIPTAAHTHLAAGHALGSRTYDNSKDDMRKASLYDKQFIKAEKRLASSKKAVDKMTGKAKVNVRD